MSRAASTLPVLLALVALLSPAARADIDIQVSGVDEDIRRNVLVFLSL